MSVWDRIKSMLLKQKEKLWINHCFEALPFAYFQFALACGAERARSLWLCPVWVNMWLESGGACVFLQISHAEQPLRDFTRALGNYGLKDGDVVVLRQAERRPAPQPSFPGTHFQSGGHFWKHCLGFFSNGLVVEDLKGKSTKAHCIHKRKKKIGHFVS